MDSFILPPSFGRQPAVVRSGRSLKIDGTKRIRGEVARGRGPWGFQGLHASRCLRLAAAAEGPPGPGLRLGAEAPVPARPNYYTHSPRRPPAAPRRPATGAPPSTTLLALAWRGGSRGRASPREICASAGSLRLRGVAGRGGQPRGGAAAALQAVRPWGWRRKLRVGWLAGPGGRGACGQDALSGVEARLDYFWRCSGGAGAGR